MDNIKKAYMLYEALKASEHDILHNGVHFKEGLQFTTWDWRQGVGLYGIWKLYVKTQDTKILDYLEGWLERRLQEGKPTEKHINTVCPMLTLAHIYEIRPKAHYIALIEEWVDFILYDLAKTQERGFQHQTAGGVTANKEQLWDDTLFMTVLFLAKAGVILQNEALIDEAERQFLVHAKYLTDQETNLWYHAYTFLGNHAFSKALWGRGNAWVTVSIPEFYLITQRKNGARLFLEACLKAQVKTLKEHQDASGLWHTLIIDKNSYLESTGSAGFAYGIELAIELGLLCQCQKNVAVKAKEAILSLVNETTGLLEKASDGTPLGMDLAFYHNVALNTRAYAQGLALMCLTL